MLITQTSLCASAATIVCSYYPLGNRENLPVWAVADSVLMAACRETLALMLGAIFRCLRFNYLKVGEMFSRHALSF